MKESKLIEMQKRQEILGNAVNRILFEIDQLKTLSVGNMELVKFLPGYDEALEQLKKKQDEAINSNPDSAKHNSVSGDGLSEGGLEGID